MIWLFAILPFVCGALCLLRGLQKLRRTLLFFSALSPCMIAGIGTAFPTTLPAAGWLSLDGVGLVFVWITLAVYVAVVGHVLLDPDAVRHDHGYAEAETDLLHAQDDAEEADENDAEQLSELGKRKRREESPVFCTNAFSVTCACTAFSLSMMLFCLLSRHLGLMWVAIEGTTLATAPLIALHHDRRSLEATWKYLILCSVGIALALLGNFMLSASASSFPIEMTLENLRTFAPMLNPVWLKAAFIFFLVGYGTKMGLVPMHSWLPDAHSEAPAPVSALLSGATLNCALFALLRVHGVMGDAGLSAFSGELFIWFGAVSVCVAALFMVEQNDFKRLLAYSSVENMGLISLAIGLNSGVAMMLHTAGHSFAKTAMFLLAGNIVFRVGSTSVHSARGLIRRLPRTAVAFATGAFVLCGVPPGVLFFSKFSVIIGLLAYQQPVLCGFVVVGVCIAMLGLIRTVLFMVFAPPPAEDEFPVSLDHHVNPAWRGVLFPAALLFAVVVCGMFIPVWFTEYLRDVARWVGVGSW